MLCTIRNAHQELN